MTTATTALTVTAIDAHYYLAKDFARAIAFYRDVIGLEIATQGDDYAEFGLADGSSFGMSILPDGRWFAGGGVMFAVPDGAVALAKLKDAGVTILTNGLEESPVCYTAWCLDTEGNTFAIHQRKG